MKNKLHQSEELAKHFAPYRDEAPLLSAPQIEKLIAERDMLPNPSTKSINVRRIIMTLSGITGLAAVAYFAFFGAGSRRTQTTYGTQGTLPRMEQALSIKDSTQQQKQTIKQTTIPKDEHGPWSAGNDQYYADLSKEELAKLGIVVFDDSVIAYKMQSNDTIESMSLTSHSIGGGKIVQKLPYGLYAPRIYPTLMTYGNGQGAAYVIDDGKRKEWGMVGDNQMMKQFRDWLERPGTQGYHALGFNSSMYKGNDNIEFDTIKIQIGKNFPQPSLFPFSLPRNFSDSVNHAMAQLAHYYDGSSNSKPTITWPKTLTIKIDTVTPKDMLDEMDLEENSSTLQHLHSIMARLNELVPVIVRPHGGSDAPDSSDFVFWYEPSEELFNALPPVQAAIFRGSKAPHCMNTPEAVTVSAEVTYCETESQQVQVNVYDLSGHVVMSLTQQAESGDNIAKVDTRSLPSGIYIVSVRDKDGSQRTRRIWVQNAHPTR